MCFYFLYLPGRIVACDIQYPSSTLLRSTMYSSNSKLYERAKLPIISSFLHLNVFPGLFSCFVLLLFTFSFVHPTFAFLLLVSSFHLISFCFPPTFFLFPLLGISSILFSCFLLLLSALSLILLFPFCFPAKFFPFPSFLSFSANFVRFIPHFSSFPFNSLFFPLFLPFDPRLQHSTEPFSMFPFSLTLGIEKVTRKRMKSGLKKDGSFRNHRNTERTSRSFVFSPLFPPQN